MAKHLPKSQRADRDYVKDQLADFLHAIANDDAQAAEDAYNEVTGVMCAMMERMEGYQ